MIETKHEGIIELAEGEKTKLRQLCRIEGKNPSEVIAFQIELAHAAAVEAGLLGDD